MSHSVSPVLTTYSSGALAVSGMLLPVAMVRWLSCAVELTGSRPVDGQAGDHAEDERRTEGQIRSLHAPNKLLIGCGRVPAV